MTKALQIRSTDPFTPDSSLANGGTGADLSGTGPGYLYQPSVGGAVEISDQLRIAPGSTVAPRHIEDEIGIGTDALNPGGYIPSGYGSVAIGYRALASATSGDNNVAVGSYAAEALTTGNRNVAIGEDALPDATTAYDNAAIGSEALLKDVTGANNVAVGSRALHEMDGDNNVAVGVEALYGGIRDNQIVNGTFATADNWTAGAGWAIVTGSPGKAYKNADGIGTLSPTSGGVSYIDFGVGGAYHIEYTVADLLAGSEVTASFGGVSDVPRNANGNYTWTLFPTTYPSALLFTPTNGPAGAASSRFSITNVLFISNSNADAVENTAVGVGALYQTVRTAPGTGTRNTAVGLNAHRQHTIGNDNIAIGVEAMLQNGDGDRNVVVGKDALYKSLHGSRNVALGYCAGFYETGDDKLFVDNRQRASEADARIKALIYGIFADAAADQRFVINALLTLGYVAGPYADNAAAKAAGLTDGQVYRTATGVLMVVYT